jgi:hypothetical protein
MMRKLKHQANKVIHSLLCKDIESSLRPFHNNLYPKEHQRLTLWVIFHFYLSIWLPTIERIFKPSISHPLPKISRLFRSKSFKLSSTKFEAILSTLISSKAGSLFLISASLFACCCICSHPVCPNSLFSSNQFKLYSRYFAILL